MTTVACPTPLRCHASSHRLGSVAARACAAALRPSAQVSSSPALAVEPAPGLTPAQRRRGIRAGLPDRARAHLQADTVDVVVDVDVMSSLAAELAAQDRAHGWVQDPRSPATHPTGGYVSRSVSLVSSDGGAQITHRNASGREHRDDGPAVIRYDSEGHVVDASWCQRGQLCRTQGPARVITVPRAEVLYALGGAGLWGEDALVEVDDLLAAGARAQDITTWLAYSRAAGQEGDGVELAGEGVSAQVALELSRAGVFDREVVLAVSAGELPMSWAGGRGALSRARRPWT